MSGSLTRTNKKAQINTKDTCRDNIINKCPDPKQQKKQMHR